VDEIIPYQTEQDVIDILSMLNIDVRIIGKEYDGTDFTGKDVCERKGIDVYYNSRSHRFSTTELRERISEETK